MEAEDSKTGWVVLVAAGAGVALAAVVGFVFLRSGEGKRPRTAPLRVEEGRMDRPRESAPPAKERSAPPLPGTRPVLRERPAEPSPPPSPPPSSRVEFIAGFETEKDLRIYENLDKRADAKRVTEHATQGLYSLRVRPVGGKRARLSGSAWLGLKVDWSWAKKICLDVYVEEGAPLAMKLEIRDKEGGSGWDPRREMSFTLNQGANPIEYRIEDLVSNDRKRKIVLSNVYQFHILWTSEKAFTVYIDSIRLEE